MSVTPEFFTDRDCGAKILPDILRGAGLTVHRHADRFAANAPDAEWLPVVASRGWVIVSLDKAMQRNPLEREAIISSRARFLALVGGQSKIEELGQNFVRTLPAILRFIERHPPPFFGKVYRPTPKDLRLGKESGRIDLVFSAKTLERVRRYGKK